MLYRSRDFQESIPPRIMGSETEYNVQNMTDEMNLMPYLDDDTYYRETGRDDGTDVWLQNGARLYVDCGGLLEYATPEVLSAQSLLEHERAGEEVVRDVANQMQLNVPGATGSRNAVYKRSGYDIPGRSRQTAGHHENYTCGIPDVSGLSDKSSHPLHRALQSYLSTRQVWAGAGMLRNGYYALGQKMDTIDFSARSKTTHEGSKMAYDIRPVNNISHLEIRTSDGNMMDWAIMQKYAFTSLVIRMIEHGDFPDRLLIDRGTASSHFQRTNDNQRINLNDSYVKPASHQRMIAQAAIDFIDSHPEVPPEEQKAALEVFTACAQIESLDESLYGADELADRLDWAAKLTMLRSRGIYEMTNLNSAALMLDLRWEDIAVNGLARAWNKATPDSTLATPSAIELSRLLPPPTRAMARVALLEEGSTCHDDFRTINWGAVEGERGYISLPDPYQTSV